jgi:hypothetical protein
MRALSRIQSQQIQLPSTSRGSGVLRHVFSDLSTSGDRVGNPRRIASHALDHRRRHTCIGTRSVLASEVRRGGQAIEILGLEGCSRVSSGKRNTGAPEDPQFEVLSFRHTSATCGG